MKLTQEELIKQSYIDMISEEEIDEDTQVTVNNALSSIMSNIDTIQKVSKMKGDKNAENLFKSISDKIKEWVNK